MATNDQQAVCEELQPGSEKLFLFFGGINGNIGMPPFEFYRAAKILNSSKIFLRDLHQSWYQRGLPSIGNDAAAVGEYINRKIGESGATQVRFVGNSMGGFAALLFCAMLRRGETIAFAPQTFIHSEAREVHGDQRWLEPIAQLHASRRESDIYKLREWIQERFPEMKAQVFVSTAAPLDMVHAKELSDFPNVEIKVFSEGGHKLVRHLNEIGMLEQILNR